MMKPPALLAILLGFAATTVMCAGYAQAAGLDWRHLIYADLRLVGAANRPQAELWADKIAANTAPPIPAPLRCDPTSPVRFLNVHGVAARCGVSVPTIWRWLKNGMGLPAPIHLSNGTTRWRIADLDAFDDALAPKPSDTIGKDSTVSSTAVYSTKCSTLTVGWGPGIVQTTGKRFIRPVAR